MGFKTSRTYLLLPAALMLAAATLGTAGCGNFFVCEGKTDCPSSGTGTGTVGTASGNYAYVSDNVSSSTSLSVYDLSTGSPEALAASPIQLNYAPTAMVITPNDQYLFASSPTDGGIFAYTINSNGGLTNPNGSVVAGTPNAFAMDVSPDGKELYALVELTVGGYGLTEYSIGTNGILSSNGTSPVAALLTPGSASVKVAPGGDFVVVTMGSSGDYVFPLASDLFSSTGTAISVGTGVGDFAVTIDSTGNIYLGRTGLIAVYSTNAGVPSANPVNTASTDSGDHSIVLASNANGNYVYTGNIGSGTPVVSTISAFTIGTGEALVSIASPYSAPSSVSAVGVDKSGEYFVAAGSGTGGIVEYAIGSTGALTASSTTAATGTSVTPVMALTH